MKIAKDTRGTAQCSSCVFGRCVTIVDTDKKGHEISRHDCYECHVARPTRYGFPVVRKDDFCALHVDATTLEQTFKGLVSAGATVTA